MSAGTIILLTISTISLVCMLTFNALSGSGTGGKLFISSVSEVSDRYKTFITPAGWAFIIWTLIFLWLALGQVFFIVSFFIKENGKRIIHDSASSAFLIFTSLNFLLNTSWIFITDRAYNDAWLLGLGYGVLFLIVITNLTACGILASNISKSKNSIAYKIVNRIILNGYCLYTTWTVIASLINLNQAIIWIPFYEFDAVESVQDLSKIGAYVCLGLLVATHVTYFFFENFVFEESLRWILTPYVVVIWASSAVYDKKHGIVPKGIDDFTLAIIIIASITLAVRLVLVAIRSLKK